MFCCSIDAHSADAFEAAVAPLLGSHRMRASGVARGSFNLQHQAFRQLTVSTITYGRQAAVEVTAAREHWAISRVMSGTVGVDRDADRVRVTPDEWFAYAPDGDSPLFFDADARVTTIAVPLDALASAHRLLIGGSEPLCIRSGVLERPDARERLDEVIQRLRSCGKWLERSSGRYAQLHEELALCELVTALLGPQSFGSRGDGQSTSTALARRVRDHIHENVANGMTLNRLAQEMGTGVRWLSAAFTREFAQSPMRYLRDLRLDRARLDLLCGTESVTDIAVRWGFWNLGDFARHYRKRHGVTPGTARERRA